MAVAIAPDAVGAAEESALVRGPFVLTPNVPTVVAPGDEFDASVTVANGVEGSGDAADIPLGAEPSEHLEILQSPASPIRIAEGREATVSFRLRAREKLGSGSIVFRAALGDQRSSLRSTLSVRPAVPFMTSVSSGNFTGSAVEVKATRALHPDFRKLEATASALPLGLARGLRVFLENYPNGCSEQISSAAFARLLLADEADFGLSKTEVRAQLEHTFGILRQRQNDQGSFGYWAADNNDAIDFVSVYVMHLLIEAKGAGFAPPPALIESGLRHLQRMGALEPGSLREARIVAYAIYLLTREGVITTNYFLNLRDTLDKRWAKAWPGDLTAVYLAGACALLKKDEDAARLIAGFHIGQQDPRECWDFYSPLGADSQYIAVLARHFPERLKKLNGGQLSALLKPIAEGRFNTLSAAYAVLALKSYSQQLAKNAPELTMAELDRQGRESPIVTSGGDLLKRGIFSANAGALRFGARNTARGIGAFYQMVEAGYDRALPKTEVRDGLEIHRDFPNEAILGEPVTVRLRVRSIGRGEVQNVAIVDLLPGAFEIAVGSLQPGAGAAGCDYVDVREDRVVFFTTVGQRIRELTYQIKPTNRGTFVVPPVFAESMYDPAVKARALPGTVTVRDPL